MKKKNKSFWKSPQGIAALVFISFPTYFLLIEHQEHIFEFLPYMFLVLCLVMHLFMHGSHGHHHSTKPDNSSDSFNEKTAKNMDYRDGYIEGLKAGRDERRSKENDNAR